MRCILCGEKEWYWICHYKEPDMYEKMAGIQDTHRIWKKCIRCGHYQQDHNYDPILLEKCYVLSYRDKKIRGEDIGQAFERIINLPDSENNQRVGWFLEHYPISTKNKSLLDVGTGLGILPYKIKQCSEFDVYFNELNHDSIEFCKSIGLKMEDEHDGLFDVVSIVHVLEHTVNPINFLKEYKNKIRYGGHLFIEIPDAVTFNILPFDIEYPHDEYNSCHLHFFTTDSIIRTIEKAGFKICDLHKSFYKDRKLSRISVLAENSDVSRID